MTRDELLAKIDSELVIHGQRGNIVKHSFALRAVVQLHKPVMQWSGGYDGEENPLYAEQCSDCSSNGFTQEYPCQTIQAIEKELKMTRRCCEAHHFMGKESCTCNCHHWRKDA